MHIEPFGVEIWMNAWETRCDWNLAETCVDSLSLNELLELTGQHNHDLSALLDRRMTYGDIEGSPRLRVAIAKRYRDTTPEQITTTHGTIGANMLVHKTLVGRDDHVVSVVPTYQQHYSIPASLGADIKTLALREDNLWLPDLDALAAAVNNNTRLIALTNPNNPTGALIPRDQLEAIVAIADRVGAWVLCDEVYRGTEQPGVEPCPSIVELYDRGISTASVSKAYSLAGLRLGWIAGPRDFIEQVSIHRDYDTISVGILDDHFATLALEHSDAVLQRSRDITARNLTLLDRWISEQPRLSYIKPKAGTTALVKVDTDQPSEALCIDLLRDTGVMFTPGSALNMEGYVRIGYANNTTVLENGLAAAARFLSP